MKKLFIFIFLTCFMLVACVKKEYYENGNVKSQIHYKGNIKYLEETFYENGNIKSQIQYKKKKKEGVTKTFYNDGKIESEIQYKNEQKRGISQNLL